MKKSKAQGILEVVIAIYIAVVGILSIMNLVVANLRVERFNHNMLKATNLAREGVEVVRNIRDSNWIDGLAWSSGLLPDLAIDGDSRTFILDNKYPREDQDGYILEYISIPWDKCLETGQCKLFLAWPEESPNQKIYVHKDSMEGLDSYQLSDANFYRIIYIDAICYNDEWEDEIINTSPESECEYPTNFIGLQVTSLVGWNDGGSIKTTQIQERIYNWK